MSQDEEVPEYVDSAADLPIYEGLASPEELGMVVRMTDAQATGPSCRLKIGQKLGRGSEGDVFKV